MEDEGHERSAGVGTDISVAVCGYRGVIITNSRLLALKRSWSSEGRKDNETVEATMSHCFSK